MLKREDYIKAIVDTLAILQKSIELRSIVGLYDANVIAEDFMQNLLNIVYDYELRNLNVTTRNQTSIDLGDLGNRVSFQVTATKKRGKIQETIDKFIKNTLYEQYSQLYICILQNKQKSYEPFDTKGYFSFNTEEHILDFRDLVKRINSLNTKKLKQIKEFLDSEISIEKSTKNQFTPAEHYQIALHWVENGRKESMYGFNLSDCVLWGVDLERADLRKANLRNANLGRANLQKANLCGADLRGANLFNTALHEAKIDNETQIDDKWKLVLEITQVGGGAKKRNLRGIDLSNAILVWGELTEADLTDANLSGSTLCAAKLSGANLTNANLNEVDLTMANLHGANLREADLSKADLRQANLSEADLRGANLSDATIEDSISPSNLTGAKYNNSTIWPGNFIPAQWGVVFKD